jgi:hypothetical protein
MSASQVEISDDVFIIRKETADAYKKSIDSRVSHEETDGHRDTGDLEGKSEEELTGEREDEGARVQCGQTGLFSHITWTGEIPPQKWMNFNTKVVSKFAASKGSALRELRLDPEVKQ